MKCPRCQQDSPSHAKFCFECGVPVGGATSTLSSYAELEAEVEASRRSLREALDQQTATSEILRVISGSPTDLQPVMAAIVETTARLAEAEHAMIGRAEGDVIRWLATYGTTPTTSTGQPITRSLPTGRAILDRQTTQIEDVANVAREFPETVGRAYRERGVRTILATPLLREGVAVGVLLLRRTVVQPFTDQQIALLKTFADQAVIAMENVRLFTELQTSNRDLTTALEQQTATSEILQAISSSTTELQPVFDTIVRNAARVCEAFDAVVVLADGEEFVQRAHHGPIAAVVGARYPLRGTVSGRAILEARVVQVENLAEASDYPAGRELAQRSGYRTTLSVPLLREGAAIGAVGIRRIEVLPFNEQQIALLQTFADQAVIAIENVRLFRELEARNRDLTTALDRQTATSEILRVISQAPTDAHPVFEAVARHAMRLCESTIGVVSRYDGEFLHLVAHSHHDSPEAVEMVKQVFPARPSRAMLHGRVVLEGAVVHLPDVFADPDFRHSIAVAFRARSALGVPMLLDGRVIGVVAVARAELRPFADSQIALLQTFADQAVIAVENVRLFTELQASNRELTTALDTQTATSDILRVISHSRTDVQPVFDAILASAVHLLRGHSGVLTRVARDQIELAALTSTDEAVEAAWRARFPRPRHAPGMHATAMRDRAPLNIADSETDARVSEAARAVTRLQGFRSWAVVPLLRHDEGIGTIGVSRREPGGFTDDEIGLLQTFADQAVIAIENVRLFTELQASNRELTKALDTQTATGDILRSSAARRRTCSRCSTRSWSARCACWAATRAASPGSSAISARLQRT